MKSQNDSMPDATIIIPAFNEEKYISKCLDSIISNDYPKDKLEILVVDGNSTDKTESIVKKYEKKYGYIHYKKNVNRTPPFALNMGINCSKGEYIIRMDTHSSYPTNYISALIYWSRKLDADNVGGICKTDVLNKTKKSIAIARVLSNRIGVGNAFFRIGVDKPKLVDTVPFGCYKKKVFDRIGLFDERLSRSQDIELNKRLISGGGNIYLVPQIECTYYARENFTEFAKNNYNNGLWNILTLFYTKNLKSLSLRHFIPLIFILSIILPPIFIGLVPYLILVSIISFIAYNLLIVIVSIRLDDKTTNLINLIKSFYVIHFSYGIGCLVGIFKTAFLSIKRLSNTSK